MPSGTLPSRSPRVSHKKIPETDVPFEQVTHTKHTADMADDVLRLSLDAPAIVKVGPCARGGKHGVRGDAADHDLQPLVTVTPVGLFLPTLEALFIYGITSKVTSDCLVDCLAQWWEAVRDRFAPITTLVINLDNGPDNHRWRPQCMVCSGSSMLCRSITSRCGWRITRPSTASTTRSNAAGASSRTMGRGPYSTRLTPCGSVPGP